MIETLPVQVFLAKSIEEKETTEGALAGNVFRKCVNNSPEGEKETVASFGKKQVLNNLGWLYSICQNKKPTKSSNYDGFHCVVSFGDGQGLSVKITRSSNDSASEKKALPQVEIFFSLFLAEHKNPVHLDPTGEHINDQRFLLLQMIAHVLCLPSLLYTHNKKTISSTY